MNMKRSIWKKLAAMLMSSAAVLGMGTVLSAPAGAAEVATRKRCDFYVGNQCYDYWVPTRESCHNIGKYGTADQLRACLALFGFGVTKKP